MPETAAAPSHKALDAKAKKLKLEFPKKANIATKVAAIEAREAELAGGAHGDPGDEKPADEPKAAKKASEPKLDKAARADELEAEIGRIVHAATEAGDWQPAAADRCRECAEEIRALRGEGAELSPLIARWLG